MDEVRAGASGRPPAAEPTPAPTSVTRVTPRDIEDDAAALSTSARSTASLSTGSPLVTATRRIAREVTPEAPPVPRSISDLPPAPISPAPVSAPAAAPSDPPQRKKRDRNDPTPRSLPIDRAR
jgi:hypothetical protein